MASWARAWKSWSQLLPRVKQLHTCPVHSRRRSGFVCVERCSHPSLLQLVFSFEVLTAGNVLLFLACMNYTRDGENWLVSRVGSRGLCLARASGCVPLHDSCTLVGVPPAGCLGVALFVTERYRWSFRPLTSHFLPALFVLIASCVHVH